MSTLPSKLQQKSLWSIHTWWENIWTLMPSSLELLKFRLRMITLCTALGGTLVIESLIGMPTLSPKPGKPEPAPPPMTVLSEATSVIADNVITPETLMVYGPERCA